MRTLLALLALAIPVYAQAPAKAGAKAAAAKPAATAPAAAPKASAATPTPPPVVISEASGLVVNGDFAKTRPIDNLWDGVNSGNGLAGEVRSAYALTEKGAP